MAQELKLFKTWSSPVGLRVVWALKLKGIRYEFVDEDLSNKSPLLLQYNPVHKKIPVLVHNGKPIAESLVILEYIDETWKQYPLLPQDPQERANARFWAKFGDDKLMQSMLRLIFNKGEKEEEAFAEVFGNLKFLEQELKGKKFFGGETIGFLDIAVGCLANMIPVLEELLGVKVIDEERFPLLFPWMQEFFNVPVIKESLPPHDKMVAKFRAYLPAESQK